MFWTKIYILRISCNSFRCLCSDALEWYVKKLSCGCWVNKLIKRNSIVKKHVWRPHARIWDLPEANVLYSKSTRDNFGSFRCPPQSFCTPTVIWLPGNCAPLPALVTPLAAVRCLFLNPYSKLFPTSSFFSFDAKYEIVRANGFP